MNTRPSNREPETAEPEPHEVTAVYDNLAGLQRGLTYGIPKFLCSCGENFTDESWEDAGQLYDRHLAETAL